MKEATGELNMTVVTLVAISAVGALLYLVLSIHCKIVS